jgi:hypothetical protein
MSEVPHEIQKRGDNVVKLCDNPIAARTDSSR